MVAVALQCGAQGVATATPTAHAVPVPTACPYCAAAQLAAWHAQARNPRVSVPGTVLRTLRAGVQASMRMALAAAHGGTPACVQCVHRAQHTAGARAQRKAQAVAARQARAAQRVGVAQGAGSM